MAEQIESAGDGIKRLQADLALAQERYLTAERTVREQRVALERCIDTAKELRRHIDPNHGCGYLVYKEVWDASRAAEIDALAALSEMGDGK